MDLRESLLVVWRRRWLVALAALVAAGAAFAYSARQPKIYVAQAKVFIGPGNSPSSDPNSVAMQVTLSQDFLTSYAQVLQTRTLAAQAVAAGSLPISPDALVGATKALVVPSTRIIVVTVQDNNPTRAAQYANTLVGTFVKSSVTQFNNQVGVLASVLEPAIPPTVPASPKPVRNAALGGFLGLVLGVCIVFLLDQLDPRLRSREEVERIMAPLPILTAIPGSKDTSRQLLFEKESNSPGAEAFRILRTNAQFFSLDEEPFARVLVTSPQGEDGKTTVAVNLAASLAASGARTLLVETDLRRPTASTYFGTPKTPGLSDVLQGEASLAEASHQTRLPNLTLVPAGTVPVNPSELLGSVQMVQLLDEMSGATDVLVLDTPPALVVTDAALLALHVDGVLLVLRAGKTHREGARKTKELFEQMGVRLLGVVVNFASGSSGYGYPYHYHYYPSQPEGRKQVAGRAKPGARHSGSPAPPAPEGNGDRPRRSAAVEPIPATLRTAPLRVPESEPAAERSARRGADARSTGPAERSPREPDTARATPGGPNPGRAAPNRASGRPPSRSPAPSFPLGNHRSSLPSRATLADVAEGIASEFNGNGSTPPAPASKAPRAPRAPRPSKAASRTDGQADPPAPRPRPGASPDSATHREVETQEWSSEDGGIWDPPPE